MLTTRLALLTLAAVAIGTALAGCGGSLPTSEAPMLGPDGTPVVATWTADTLTLAAFDAAYSAAEGAIVDTTQTPLERRLDFLDRYVDFRLKVTSAREAGYAEDSAYVAEIDEYRDQLAGPYFLDRNVLDDLVRELYERQQERVRVAHILLLLSPASPDTALVYGRANALKDSIEAGLIDFEEAALKYSQDPSAPSNRGNLGFISGGRTLKGFEDAAYSTPIGTIGGPVRTRFGVHLVKPLDRQPMRAEIKASHILIQTSEAVSVDSARAVIEGLRARALAGEDFAALAQEFSDDTGSAVKGGDLGKFGRGQMVGPFEEAAFALVNEGDLSEPVESRFGVHLILLTQLPPRPTYEEAYDGLRELALRLPRSAVRRQAVGRDYIAEVGGSYNEALVREAVEQYPADSVIVSVVENGFSTYNDSTFATIGDQAFTLGELRRPLTSMRFGPHPGGEMIEFARAFVDERASDEAIGRLEDRDPEFARVFRSYTDGVLLFRIAEDSVWTPARTDVAGLRATYDADPGAYRWPQRRRALAFRATSDSLLRALAADLDAGTPPALALDSRINLREQGQIRLDTLFVADSTGSALDLVLGLEVGERSEVVLDRASRVVYLLEAIEPPRGKTFEESRAQVITDYQETVETRWETRLRARYGAQVYPERVPPTSSVAPPEGSGPGAVVSDGP